MIYRFQTTLRSSGSGIEFQIQAPAGTPVDEIEPILRATVSQQGIEVESSFRYLGTIDTDFEGIAQTIWYTPTADVPANRVCVVKGCGQPSAFHLCEKHALPGAVMEFQGQKFVISTWLVEREGKMRVISLNDYGLGDLFGGREAFERRLVEQGYHIHHLISQPDQLDTTRRQNPGLPFTVWSPDLPHGEDDLSI